MLEGLRIKYGKKTQKKLNIPRVPGFDTRESLFV